MGDKCTNVELAWDPASGPGRTIVIKECPDYHPSEEWKALTARLRTALQPPSARPTARQPSVPQPAAQLAPSVPATPAEHLAAIEAYIAASGGPVKKTSCGAIAAPADVPAVQTLQDASTGLHRALVQAREDVRCITGVDAARMAEVTAKLPALSYALQSALADV